MARLREKRLGSAERPGTFSPEQARWYAIQTRARHEKRIGSELQQKGIHAFVPTLRQVHSWSDRTKTVEVPLFSCYVFVNLLASAEQRLEVLKTTGVFQFVRVNGNPAPIPDSQIEGIQTVLANNFPVTTSDFIRIGQRVRIRGGSLDGVEGILSARKGAHALVISVDLIQQSVEVTVDGYAIETV
jgi:transcription antitermination factor NusG